MDSRVNTTLHVKHESKDNVRPDAKVDTKMDAKMTKH